LPHFNSKKKKRIDRLISGNQPKTDLAKFFKFVPRELRRVPLGSTGRYMNFVGTIPTRIWFVLKATPSDPKNHTSKAVYRYGTGFVR
jgi:hypothetical protein